jgi:hypothetical protein
MADADETLEINDNGYLLLPDDVLGLRLHWKKAIIRLFMDAVRRMYYSQLHHIFVLMNYH